MNESKEGTDDYKKYRNAVGSFKKLYLGLLVDKHKIRGALFPVTNELDELGSHSEYGAVATWDVREVTAMTSAFAPGVHRMNGAGSASFWAKPDGGAAKAIYHPPTLDLSFWDTRNVESMSGMFRAYPGDVEVGTWDTGKVKIMSNMFDGAGNFNGDIGSWDTSKVKNMEGMFSGATKFDRDLRKWNLGSAKYYSDMFAGSAMAESNKPPKVSSRTQREDRLSPPPLSNSRAALSGQETWFVMHRQGGEAFGQSVPRSYVVAPSHECSFPRGRAGRHFWG
jgi:surface protein